MHLAFNPRCACGLSKNAPWCDNSHTDTGIILLLITAFKPIKWTVPSTVSFVFNYVQPQAIYSICGCKYTKSAPFCDSMHNEVAVNVVKRLENCKEDHAGMKLCVKCGHADGYPDIKGRK
jgi:CDGSH-type Zn-finger protein